MSLYIGLDSSTQSLTAVVIEIAGEHRRVVATRSCGFDATFPAYGTRHGVLPHPDPLIATSSPIMWAEALDTVMRALATDGVDLESVAAICGSAQQHGSVYLNRAAAHGLAHLEPSRTLADQVAPMLSRTDAPVWMDSSTSVECAEITAAVGGADVLARTTGSRAFERFTGPQIRKFWKHSPEAYAATDRIHLVSSFLCSLLAGCHAPIDTGDGSGMNLLDLTGGVWWTKAVEATAPDLERRLPPIVPPWTIVGPLSRYWQDRCAFPPASVIVWSGDNPCSVIGTGLVREGRVAISMGTSDTVFGLMREPRLDASGIGHVFGAPTGDFMGLTVFKNGSLAREQVRQSSGLTWEEFSNALSVTAPGSGGIMLPWFEPEITPNVPVPGVRRYGAAGDSATTIRALVESQLMAMARHSAWMGVRIDTIHATGGAAANRAILQVMADVFGAEVYQFEVANSAALGAALRAAHAHALSQGRRSSWDEIVHGFAEPLKESRLTPDRGRHVFYQEWMRVYALCEAHALGRGSDPGAALARVQGRAER